MRRRQLLVIVATLLVGVAWWVWRLRRVPTEVGPAVAAGGSPRTAPVIGPPAGGSRVAGAVGPTTRDRLLAEADRLWDEQSPGPTPVDAVETRLRRFLLRGASFVDVPLAEVLEDLRRRMIDLGSGDLAALAKLRVEGRPSGRVRLSTGRQLSAWAVLRLAAAQAGMGVAFESDGSVVLRPIGPPADPGADGLVTRAAPIDAFVLRDLMREAGLLDGVAAGDPFGEAAPQAPLSSEAVRAFLDSLGLALAEGGWVDFDAESGHLAVHGSARDAALVEAVAGLADTTGWPQVYLQSRVVRLDQAGPIAEQILGGGDVELLLQALNDEGGSSLVSMPSVVTRPGQAARVEIVRETAVAGSDGMPVVEPRGLILDLDPAVEGERQVNLNGSLDLSTTGVDGRGEVLGLIEAGNDGLWSAVDDLGASSGDRQVTDFEAVLRRGEAAALMAFDDGAGGKVLALVSATLIDPAGQPIDSAAGVPGRGR